MAEGKPKFDKFDEYGQLTIGYDLAKARARVLERAPKNLCEEKGNGTNRR